jgi:hypothetical protein
MPLGFPNQSRFYDGAVHAVRFSGYDGALEAPFFIGERALKQIQPDMPFNESGLLKAFDLNRERIYATQTKYTSVGAKARMTCCPRISRSDLGPKRHFAVSGALLSPACFAGPSSTKRWTLWNSRPNRPRSCGRS